MIIPEIRMRQLAATLAAAALLAGVPVLAQHHAMPGAAKAAPAREHTQGEVRKVDKEAGKVTLKHGAIPNLEMPPMTMVFKVQDLAMLDKVKAGDAVRFKAENIAGSFTVTDIQPLK